MNRLRIRQLCMAFTTLTWLGLGLGLIDHAAAEEKETGTEKGVDVLAHGPIHEAFAETVVYDPEAGIIVPKAPPEAINEIPPTQKPEGKVVWIPGYWAWDDDRDDFIWVSGVWRAVPPGRQWVPGYWAKCEGGYQWISGYWADVNETETAYLPEPPASVEVGPNVRPVSADHVWIPGCWVWHHGAYAWRPGYWTRVRPGWVWVPAHYVWTPRGYIFVGGYWDYVVYRRGVLFAPVFFGVGVTVGPGFCFVPSFVIDLRIFSDCLFWRPHYHHYYFGDYYAPRYYHRGIFPWFSPHARRYGYHTIYVYQRWEHRHDRDWERKLHDTYQHRRQVEAARPPRSFHDPTRAHQKPLITKTSAGAFKGIPGSAGDRDGISRFRPMGQDDRARMERQGKEVYRVSRERMKVETQTSGSSQGPSMEIDPHKATLPRSPIASRPTGSQGRQERPTGGGPTVTPPKRPTAPQPNPMVEPLQKRVCRPPDLSETRGHRPETLSQPGPTPPKQSIPGPVRLGPGDRPATSRPNPSAAPSQGSPPNRGGGHEGPGPSVGGQRPHVPGR